MEQENYLFYGWIITPKQEETITNKMFLSNYKKEDISLGQVQDFINGLLKEKFDNNKVYMELYFHGEYYYFSLGHKIATPKKNKDIYLEEDLKTLLNQAYYFLFNQIPVKKAVYLPCKNISEFNETENAELIFGWKLNETEIGLIKNKFELKENGYYLNIPTGVFYFIIKEVEGYFYAGLCLDSWYGEKEFKTIFSENNHKNICDLYENLIYKKLNREPMLFCI